MISTASRGCRFAFCAALAALAWLPLVTVDAGTLRVVTYNMQADTGGYTTARPGFFIVIEGIGDEVVEGVAQPVDILALQETTSNATTVAPIVTQLNTIYGAGTYAMSPYQATQNGSASSGNGPNALVYKTTALQLIASVGIGTPSSSGAPRQPVRYQFRPVGGTAANDFYVYVSHYKAGTTSSDLTRRNVEAQLIRSDEAGLPATARVIYTGDYNLSSSSEASYQTITASGQGQAFDPPDRPGDWALNSEFVDVLTYSSTNLRYRDDFHLVTQNIMEDASGLYYVASSYHTFGINGTTAIHGSVDSTSNTALPGLTNRAAVLTALTTAADHLPVVADFEIDVGGTAPEITGEPNSVTVCFGGSASFTVTATGSPTPTYQWREGTTNLTSGGNISGATTATLTINPVGTSDAATTYNCVVTNSNGSATSNSASLTVNVAAALSAQPSSQTVCSGGSASFSVTATGTPAPTYQWRKGTTNLTNGGGVSGATTATLTINPVATSDAATTYNCVVTNTCGAATSNNASLTVNVAAALTAQPGNQTVCAGGSASFSVTATGSPAPTYQWRKGTTNLADGDNISGATTATLIVNPVGSSDAAVDYNCVVTNTCGSDTSDNASLTVNVGPSIVTQPQGQALVVGSPAVFSVASSDTPSPTYQWRKNSVLLTDGGSIFGSATATLTINPVAATDAGNYDVVLTNACDVVTSARAPLWRRGDMNCDGVISYADINPFVLALGGQASYDAQYPDCNWLNADCNNDGSVSYADINPFVQLLSAGL